VAVQKFVKMGPQEGTNFGIGTLAEGWLSITGLMDGKARRRGKSPLFQSLEGLNLEGILVAKNLHLRPFLLISRE
jgi:hypothetical protein